MSRHQSVLFDFGLPWWKAWKRLSKLEWQTRKRKTTNGLRQDHELWSVWNTGKAKSTAAQSSYSHGPASPSAWQWSAAQGVRTADISRTCFTVLDPTPYSSDLAPSGFLPFPRLKKHRTRHHYPSDGKLRQRLSNGSVNKIHIAVVTEGKTTWLSAKVCRPQASTFQYSTGYWFSVTTVAALLRKYVQK